MDRAVSVPEALQLVVQCRKAGRLKQAADVCQRILNVDGSNADALFHLGCIELQAGAPAQAVTHLSAAVSQRGESAITVYTLGCAHDAALQRAEAVSAFRRAIELKPDFGPAHHCLAAALFRTGDLDESLASATRALEIGTQAAESRHLRAQVLQQLGDFEAAIECHRQALETGAEVRRCQVIQAVIASRQVETYLEIGVDTGSNLQFVHVSNCLAVDPIPPSAIVTSLVDEGRVRYFEMTSDQFFKEQRALFKDAPLEAAFVDGLHTYQQVLADVENCLDLMGESGVVLMHDCNPTTEAMAIPAASYEESTELRKPGESTDWTGDVWKAVVALRSSRTDLTTHVLDCDYGIGVVVRRPQPEAIDLGDKGLEELSYSDLEADRDRLLGLVPPRDLWRILDLQ